MHDRNGSSYDVIVIGAGPSGCAAALSAKRGGAGSVLLLEKEKIPRNKICAGGITPWAVRTMEECGFPSDIRKSLYDITGAEAVTGKGKSFNISGTFKAGVVLRSILDHNLAAAAAESGVIVQDQAPVARLLFEGSRVSGVQTGNCVFESRHVVIANGGMSHFHQDRRKRLYTATIMARYTGIEHSSRIIKLVFDPRIAPCFCWWFPESADSFNVGLGVDKQVLQGVPLKELFHQLLDTHFSGLIKGKEPDFIGSFPILADPVIEHHPFPGSLVVGEANRLVHNFSGEGIAGALQSGRLAGETIAMGIRDRLEDHGIETLYLTKLENRLGRYIKTSRFLRKHGVRLLNSTQFLVKMKPVKKLVVRSLGCP